MPQVTVSREAGGAAVVTLNRPERRNALSLELMRELTDTLDRIARQEDVRAVILAAAGKVFSSGHDLTEMTGRTLDEYRALFAQCTALMQQVQSIRQPVIAEVQGLATAAGCQLVATCDLAVASEDAQFATPGVKIGLFCTTPGVALARAVAPKKALEMLFTGQPISAAEAEHAGLVNRVVPRDRLDAETLALARQIAAASPAVVSLGKRAFYRQLPLPCAEAYAVAQPIMAGNAVAAAAREGIRAFLEKREPRWQE